MPETKKATDIATDNLEDLDAAEYTFLMGLIEGKLSQAEAYRQAWPTDADMRSVYSMASRRAASAKFQAWLRVVRQGAGDRAARTLEEHTAQLTRLREIALQSGNVGAAVLAEISTGKAHNLYTENVRIIPEVEKLSDAELFEEAATRIGMDVGEYRKRYFRNLH